MSQVVPFDATRPLSPALRSVLRDLQLLEALVPPATLRQVVKTLHLLLRAWQVHLQPSV